MSADELRRRVVAELTETRERLLANVTNIRVRQGGAGTPASTCEEIAMNLVEKLAEVRGYDAAIESITTTFRKMTQSDQPARLERRSIDV